MREIKFREWDTERKTMVIGEREDYDDSVGFRFVHEEGGERILMQYTNLKTRHGADIYDKDIVLHSDYDNSYIGIVEWADWGWYINGIDPKDSFDFADVSDNGVCELEILGNVYENQELLK